MPRNSSGNYSKPAGSTAIPFTTIESAKYNTLMDDIATEITGSLPRNGTAAMLANLPFGGFRGTNVGVATALTDVPQAAQILNQDLISAADTGAADAYVVTLSPAPTEYTTFMALWFTTTNANTGACTINVNSLGAKSIKTVSGGDPAAGAVSSTAPNFVIYDGTNFVLNTAFLSNAVLTTDTSTSGWSFVLDEDDLSSDSATKLATQQSIKAYVDDQVVNAAVQSWARRDWNFSGGTQSVPSATATTLNFAGATTSGGTKDFLTGAPSGGFKIPSGVSRVCIRVNGAWAIPASGNRLVETRIVRTAPTTSLIKYKVHDTPSAGIGPTYNSTDFEESFSVAEGDEYVIQGYQDNGSNLAFGSTDEDLAVAVEIFDLTAGSSQTATQNYTEYDLGTYAVNTVYRQAHGLGAYPQDVQVWLQCTAADRSYAVGDRVYATCLFTGEDRHVTTQADTTNIRVITGGGTLLLERKTGAGPAAAITASSWKFVLRVK